MISHFIKVFKSKLKAFNCKHDEPYDASCPYTGKTYTTCKKCLKRLKVVDTVE